MRKIVGPILIFIGIYLFLNRGEAIEIDKLFSYFWPSMFILPIGLLFHWMYFQLTNRRGVGLLVPGGLFLTVGIVCQISMLMDNWQYTWPGFILAPAVGLFELYWFGGRNKWLLIPVYILAGLSLIFVSVYSLGALYNEVVGSQPIVAIILIIAGLALIIPLSRKKHV